MPRDECLLARRHDEQVVITLPGESGMTNSPRIREAPVAADISAMTFCDSSGRHAVTVGAGTIISTFPDLPAALSG